MRVTNFITTSVKTFAAVVTAATVVAATMAGALPPASSFVPIGLEIEQDQDLDELIAQLSASDAYDRAMAACRIGRLRRTDISSARDTLIGLLGDGTPVESRLCREEGDWYRGRQRDESTSGREAADRP